MSERSPKKAKRSARGRWLGNRVLLGLVALVVWAMASGFAYVWCQTRVLNLGYRLSEAHRQHAKLVEESKKLHLEMARLRAPERVEQIALRQLELKHPDKDQIVVLP
jgi:cell division protein FtsL